MGMGFACFGSSMGFAVHIRYCIALLMGVVFANASPAWAQTTPDDHCWKSPAPSVHVWSCAAQALPPTGLAYALQIVVVESPKLLLILDSGATAQVGRAAALAIGNKFGARPFYILNSQPKPEHVLGNVGFQAEWANQLAPGQRFESRLVAGALTAKLMAQRCPQCIENFAKRMGGDAVSGTQPLIPLTTLTSVRGNLGLLGGVFKNWQFELEGAVQTEQALTVRSRDLGVEWVGGLVEPRLAPDLADGQVAKRIDFLGKLKTRLRKGDVLIGSEGVLDTAWVNRNLRYFADLQVAVLAAMEAGLAEVEIIKRLSQEFQAAHPEQAEALNEVHQLNIQRIYRQTEELVF